MGKGWGTRNLPSGSVVKTPSFHCSRAWILSPVRKLRSCMLHGKVKKKKKDWGMGDKDYSPNNSFLETLI